MSDVLLIAQVLCEKVANSATAWRKVAATVALILIEVKLVDVSRAAGFAILVLWALFVTAEPRR